MIFNCSFSDLGRLCRDMRRPILLLVSVVLVFPSISIASLPKRLILLLDGISYRDMKALQEGVTYKDGKRRQFHLQGFQRGYFPVSRMISTFPSASDVAWTEMLGDRPLPGYQRTYFSVAANSVVSVNGLTTTMEHEKQMHWQMESGFRRAMGYVHPLWVFRHEVRELVANFLNTTNQDDNYYAYIRSTDDAQHMSCDIFAMLCMLDEKLQELRARYKASEGRDLEILILSDHGNNHVGNTGGAMLDEQFGDLVMLRAEAGETAVVAAHPAVSAVLAAEIGNLDDRTNKNLPAEMLPRRGSGAFVLRRLRRAVHNEFGFAWKITFV